MNNLDKKKAMLLGLHIGDSLGATLEFSNGRNEENLLKEIIGGGPFQWNVGDATDDTDMMMCILKSLSEKSKFSLDDISERFINWRRSKPKDIGRTIHEAISDLILRGLDYGGIKGEFCRSNGSLMRCAPMALYDSSEEEIKKQTKLTHGEEICSLCDLIFIQALKDALAGKDKEEIYKNALARSKENQELYFSLLNIKKTSWDQLNTSGYVISSLFCAFWALMNHDSFEEALVYVINKGDDSDTCGAISGALLGAYYGLEGLPERWLNKIQYRNEIIKLVENLKIN